MGAVGNEEGDDPWMKEVEFGGFKALALKIYGMVALWEMEKRVCKVFVVVCCWWRVHTATGC